ncbi:MAG: DNA-binding protein, partial [Thermoplasmata archaeon]
MDKEEIYKKINDIMTRERFELEISERRKKYGDLLDDEAIALIILDELGRSPSKFLKINDLIDGVNASLIVTVVSIEDSIVKKNERDLKLRKIKVKDETG